MNENESGQWGIAELMGHKVVAGYISKSEMLGKPMLRVDVPATSAYPAFTQLYGEAAIYCVTFTSEEVARRTAESTKLNPVSVYVPDLISKEKYEEAQDRHQQIVRRYQAQIAALQRGLPAPRQGDDDDDDEDDDDEDDGSSVTQRRCRWCGEPLILGRCSTCDYGLGEPQRS